MNKLKYTGKFNLLLSLLALYTFFVVPFVSATELVITGNGSESSGEINIQQTNTATVEQSNTGEVTNNVEVSTDTGGNSAGGNTTGDATITTGDASTKTEVNNTLNSSTVQVDACCTGDGTVAVITENGSGSNNQINNLMSTTSTVNVTNNATVTTNISGYVNTGNNSATGNTGTGVSIITGDIKVRTTITNGPINTSVVELKLPGEQNLLAKVSLNGTESVNTVSSSYQANPTVVIGNVANIKNHLTWDLNTGGNNTSENSGGKVAISTGDIDFKLFIENLANLSRVKVDLCCDYKPLPTPVNPPTPTPSPTETNNNPAGSGSNIGGSSGSVLPAGAEIAAGGPGVLGLSDTSSGEFQSVLFMLGFLMFSMGLKFSGDALAKVNLKK